VTANHIDCGAAVAPVDDTTVVDFEVVKSRQFDAIAVSIRADIADRKIQQRDSA
jgi:hypothetical protein